jgi:transposase-like protein
MSRIYRSREEWFSLIERCEASGIPVREFCLQEGIHPSNYYYWIKRYRTKDPEFVPLRITGKSLSDTPHRYELVYPNGVILRLGEQSGLGELSQLLRLF